MKNYLKSEKGSMAVYVIVTIFSFIIILTGIFLNATSVRKNQLRTLLKIKEAYERDLEKKEEIYEEQIAKPQEPQIPEGLEIGSSVTYNLVGDEYTWNKEYASSDQTGTETLSSKTGGAFRLTDWKVLAINETTKEATLVPTGPTIGTVRLQGAQGYNNNVKLLNDACRHLYGNEAKGITARSINIEDIEELMTDTAKNGENGAYKYANATTYGNQVSSAYTSANSEYPVIYAQEKLSVINGTKKETGLDLSDEPSDFIKRNEGTAGATVPGSITTATSIQPYQTYWYKDNSFMQTAFKSYKTDNTYYNLIMPQNASTTYWVASRCVSANSSFCSFGVRRVYSGSVNTYPMYGSVRRC